MYQCFTLLLFRWKVHDDWVSQLKYYDSLRAVISCSNHQNTALVIGTAPPCPLPLPPTQRPSQTNPTFRAPFVFSWPKLRSIVYLFQLVLSVECGSPPVSISYFANRRRIQVKRRAALTSSPSCERATPQTWPGRPRPTRSKTCNRGAAWRATRPCSASTREWRRLTSARRRTSLPQEVRCPTPLALSPPRVINFKFPLQPHQKYYIRQYEELGFS